MPDISRISSLTIGDSGTSRPKTSKRRDRCSDSSSEKAGSLRTLPRTLEAGSRSLRGRSNQCRKGDTGRSGRRSASRNHGSEKSRKSCGSAPCGPGGISPSECQPSIDPSAGSPLRAHGQATPKQVPSAGEYALSSALSISSPLGGLRSLDGLLHHPCYGTDAKHKTSGACTSHSNDNEEDVAWARDSIRQGSGEE